MYIYKSVSLGQIVVPFVMVDLWHRWLSDQLKERWKRNNCKAAQGEGRGCCIRPSHDACLPR